MARKLRQLGAKPRRGLTLTSVKRRCAAGGCLLGDMMGQIAPRVSVRRWTLNQYDGGQSAQHEGNNAQYQLRAPVDLWSSDPEGKTDEREGDRGVYDQQHQMTDSQLRNRRTSFASCAWPHFDRWLTLFAFRKSNRCHPLGQHARAAMWTTPREEHPFTVHLLRAVASFADKAPVAAGFVHVAPRSNGSHDEQENNQAHAQS